MMQSDAFTALGAICSRSMMVFGQWPLMSAWPESSKRMIEPPAPSLAIVT